MTVYATLTDLVQRADGDEIVQRGLPDLRLIYRSAVPVSAQLATIADPVADDCALVEDEARLYRYDGAVWAAITVSKVDRALADASAMAEDYLRGRYQLPLAGTPAALVLMVCDIARYYLFDDRVPEVVEARYKAAVAWLKDVARGTVTLDSAAAAPNEQGVGAAVVEGPARVFSRDNMAGL